MLKSYTMSKIDIAREEWPRHDRYRDPEAHGFLDKTTSSSGIFLSVSSQSIS